MRRRQNRNPITRESLAHFPCVRKCCLDDRGICLGCFRSLEEIMHWNEASADERRAILENARQRKAAYRAKMGDFMVDDD